MDNSNHNNLTKSKHLDTNINIPTIPIIDTPIKPIIDTPNKPIQKNIKYIERYDIKIPPIDRNIFDTPKKYRNEWKRLYNQQYRKYNKIEKEQNISLKQIIPSKNQYIVKTDQPNYVRPKQTNHKKSKVNMLVDWENPKSKSEYKKQYYKNNDYYTKNKSKINRDSKIKYYGKKDVIEFLEYVNSL